MEFPKFYFSKSMPKWQIAGIVSRFRCLFKVTGNGISKVLLFKVDAQMANTVAGTVSRFRHYVAPNMTFWRETKMEDAKTKFRTKEGGSYYCEQIREVLHTCKNIDEFDIIPSVKLENISCPFVLDGTKLGIFSWCVKELFQYVYANLMEAKRAKCVVMKKEDPHLMILSKIFLLLHSENYTVWNLRKCFVTKNEKHARAELDFCALVLKKYPRSAETFSHRRWLINLLRKTKAEILETPQFIQDEFDLTLLCAERYRDNYITWDQRCWLVDNFVLDNMFWLEKELNSIKAWLWSHVSDNSVYHFRQHLLKKLAASCSLRKIKELLLEEFKLSDEILKYYPIFETIWHHRRFLVNIWSSTFGSCSTCLTLCLNKRSDQFSKHKAGKPKLKYMNKDFEMEYQRCHACETLDEGETISVANEMEFCRRFVIESDNVCLQVIRQRDLASSHLQWLQHFCQNLLKRTSK